MLMIVEVECRAVLKRQNCYQYAMLTSLLLVAALLSCVESTPVGTSNSGPDPENLQSLQYVYAFFRHGIRSPLYEAYPRDPYKTEYHNYFKGTLGELTTTGKRQMYRVGKKLKLLYGDFVGSFSEEKVRASSTNTSRTIMSALSVMAGLFPPEKPLFKNLAWQPIPIWQDTADFDKVYLFNDPNFPKLSLETCPNYGKMIKQGYDIIMNPDKTKGRGKLYELLREYSGRSDLDSINSLYELYDVLQFESLNGLQLPGWTSAPQPKYLNKPLYPNLMTPLMVEWFLDVQYLNRDKNMLPFYSGPLFDSIVDKFQDKAKEPQSPEKFRFHSTHDDTLYTFLWALGFDDPLVAVGPGDGIVFELHHKKLGEEDNYFVRVRYFNTLGDSVTELQLPQCPSPCSLTTFTTVYPRLTPKQWKEKCQLGVRNVDVV